MSIHELASKTAAYLARELEVDRSQELRIAFGLELFLGEIVELFCLLILAYVMGIFLEVIVITAAASLLRLASGGEHCSEFYRCLIGGFSFIRLGSSYSESSGDQTGCYSNCFSHLSGSRSYPLEIRTWRYRK